MSSYDLETEGGLNAFNMEGEWYVFLPALAKVVNTSNGNISVFLGRHPSLQPGGGDPQVILASRTEVPAEWQRLLKTYEMGKEQIAPRWSKRKKVRPVPVGSVY